MMLHQGRAGVLVAPWWSGPRNAIILQPLPRTQLGEQLDRNGFLPFQPNPWATRRAALRQEGPMKVPLSLHCLSVIDSSWA